jgi:hypothetical protein
VNLHPFKLFMEQWLGARWQKMALKVFKLAGGEGGLRLPYFDAERFRSGAVHKRAGVGVAEIDELVRAGGLGRRLAQLG